MMVPWKALNGPHVTTTQCGKGEKRKRRRLAEEDMRESVTRDFQAYRRPIETVTSFKYLGRIMMASENYWPSVVGNLQKAQKSWDCLRRILVRERACPRVSGILFKAVLQVVIFFWSETWLTTPRMGRALGGVSTQGSQTDHLEATKGAGWWELGIPAAGDGNAGGGVLGDGRVCSE